MKTKARTMGQRKRGRPKVTGVEREKNGRISRSKELASDIALEARARLHRITMEEAKDQQAGTYMGLLHMAYLRWKKEVESPKGSDKPQPEQSLSTAQYHALLTCQEVHNDYLKAVGAPGARYDPYLGSSGDEEAHSKWAETAKKKWTRARDAIQEAQMFDRSSNLWAALDLCVFQEQSLPHMVGSLKSLGNVLVRHFQRG